MFCKKCGKEINPSATFCSACGTRVNETPAQPYAAPTQSYAPPVQQYTPPVQPYMPPAYQPQQPVAPVQPVYNPVNPNDQVIRHSSCGASGIIKLVSLLVMGFAFIVFGAMFSSPDMGKYSVPAMGAFFIIMGIICIALGVVFYIMYQKRFCEVRANSIGGVTCGSVDFINEKYELNYADIVSVQKNGFTQLLNVRTRYNKSVKILLPPKELDYVQGVIQQKINMQTQQMYN